jgi:hypothetical protein
MPEDRDVHYPIIYVRGFAATTSEQDDTSADPFNGFNIGSTVFRATSDKDKPARKFVFESPVIRLGSDHGYSDVYDNGLDIMDEGWTGPGNADPANAMLPRRCIVIYRYYDEASSLLGSGKTPPIEHFAQGLSTLILRVRDLVCRNPDSRMAKDSFRCYLVAHSMGGLIVRAFLQNPALGDDEARKAVDKIFTYATPHNGIEMAGVNVPEFLSAMDMNNFSRERMAEYLNVTELYKKTKRVDWIPEATFPSGKFFCMIGTNRSSYETLKGLSRTFAGHGSDGLVRIDNASVMGVDKDGNPTEMAARAYTYRSHSGFFGIVNSEEAYQNLSRFLFGTNRADVWLRIDDVRLPQKLEGKNVNAAYQFEVLASPKGKPWYLTRRMADEDSVAVRSHADLTSGEEERAKVYLSSVFLDKKARVNPKEPTLTFSVTLGVRAPDYEVDKRFWFDEHFEGGYLYRDSFAIVVSPPDLSGEKKWGVSCQRDSDGADTGKMRAEISETEDGGMLIEIPVGDSEKKPGISGKLQIYASAWND